MLENSAIQYVLVSLVMLSLWGSISLRKINLKGYFGTEAGKRILNGIVWAVGISAGLALLSSVVGCTPVTTNYGRFNNGASSFAGLDYTREVSPMCYEGGQDSHTTSNLGLRYFAYESKDSRFKSNLKYTHHSCAFNSDNGEYDAAGVEFEYKLW